MIRNLCWTTIAAALLALAGGAAWAEEPQKPSAGTAPRCCDEKSCCTEYHATKPQKDSTVTVEAPSCSKWASDGGCCSQKGCCSRQAKAGCATCEGCASCAKSKSRGSKAVKGSCCAKAGKGACCAECADGCTCCCTGAAAHRGQKKKVIVYVVAPPMPIPPPPPAVYLPHPIPAAGPVTVVETPDGVRHVSGGSPYGPVLMPPAPAYPCPVPAPAVAEPVPPPAPIASDPMSRPVPGQLTGSTAVPPPPAVVPCGVAQTADVAIRCRLETATEDGTTRLKVWSGPSTCITCDHLELKVAGFGGLKVAVADKQVRLHTPTADAKADRISVTTQEDQVLLEGHVHLQYHLDEGEHADVSAHRVVVHLADGRVEIQPAKPETKATRVMPPADVPPAVFNFFTGLFH